MNSFIPFDDLYKPGKRTNQMFQLLLNKSAGLKVTRKYRLRPWLFLALLLPLAGCSDLSFYWQAGLGHLDIINRRRPIEEVLADKAVELEVKDKLRMVLRAQAYGEEKLSMPAGARFKYYSDLDRPAAVWLVVASHSDRIEEVRHCYLLVGCLGYRGFFDLEDARAFRARMEKEGHDAIIRPAQAYSTLGWFDDPVLSTYIRRSELSLVSTIFHEQAHRVLFIKGDTSFNESFASFVEEAALESYLAGRGDEGKALMAEYLQRKKDQTLFREIISRGKEQLDQFYAQKPGPEAGKSGKARLFEAIRADYQKRKNSFKILKYDGWFEQPLNNAHLVGVQQYHSWVWAFRRLYEQESKDLNRFFKAARALSEKPPGEREKALRALEKAPLAHWSTSPERG